MLNMLEDQHPFGAQNATMLLKVGWHKKSHNQVSFHSRGSPSSTLALPVHQSTRNNSLVEALLLEDITVTDLSKGRSDALKYTCLECNFKTTTKTEMDTHVHSLHVSVELEEINFVCGICKHEFTINEDYKDHVKNHDKKDNFQTVTPDQDKDLNVGH